MTIELRSLGNTGIEVTALGFGGAPIGAVGDRITEDDASAIIAAALDGGIQYLDVAPLYGHGLSEKRLGKVLRKLPRDEFVLSTKVGRLLVSEDEGERDAQMQDKEGRAIQYDYSYDGAKRSLDASLERLGVDRVDILLCHDIDVWTHGDAQPGIFETARKGILPAMVDLKEQGVVRAIGLGVNEWPVCSRIMDEFPVDCFLLAGRFTLLEQEPLKEFLPKCLDQQVSVIIGGPYNSGLLAQTERQRATYDYKPVDDARWERAQRIREVCKSHGVDIRAAALQYPLKHPAVASVIPGVWTLDELRTNFSLLSAEIPLALWTDLDDEGLTVKI